MIILCLSNTSLKSTFNDTINFHIPLIGLPLKGLIFFHKPISYQDTLIYTATEKNILAAINSNIGNLVWRQEFSKDDQINIIKPLNSKIITFSNSSIVRVWDALTGFLIWEEVFLNPFSSNKYNIDFFENNVTSNNIIVLTLNTIYSLDSNTGSHIWNYDVDLGMSPLFLSISNPFIYLIESLALSHTYPLSVLKLDGKTGKKISSNYISSISKLDDIIYVGSSPLPIIAWRNSSICNSVYIHLLDNNMTYLPFDSVKFYAPEHSNPTSSILIQFISSFLKKTWANVFFLNSSSSISKLYEIFPVSTSSAFFSRTYMSNVFFIHLFINEFGSITVNIYNDKNNYILNTWNISLNQSYNFHIEQITSEIFQKADKSIIAKLIIVTQDGSIHMIQESSILWTREESLAYSIHAEFLQLPQKHVILRQNNIPMKLNSLSFVYIQRIIRKIDNLKNVLKRIVLFDRKKLSEKSRNRMNIQQIVLQKDIFNFRQFIIIITSKGKILALDSFSSGAILWLNKLADNFDYKGLWIIRKSKTLNDPPPIIAVLGRNFKNMYFWRINGLTGEIISSKKVNNNIKNSFILDHTLTKDFDEKIIVAITNDGKIRLLHNTSNVLLASLLKNLSNIYFSTKDSNTLKGYFINFENLYANISWNIDFPSQSIISLSTRNKNEKIASIGRVLGDRSVLYKYLNSHFLAVATGNIIDSKLDIYLIDIVKGMIVYTSHYNDVDISKGVEILLSENWMIYQFWIENPTKGYQIVVSELYESGIKNKKNKGINSSSLNNVPLPFVISQVYLYPRRIQVLASVLTRYGITSRDIISYIDTNQIILIPKKLLDPRRPILINNKMPLESIEEGLLPYNVNLLIDSQSIITRKNEVYGIKHILSSSTLLESTSIILAYGHDIFLTYVTPSNSFDILNPNFNKIQLLLTIFMLIIGFFILRLMTKAKLLKKRWEIF
ncbi:hypothetical protein PCANB_000618 [Pneumocystis canis]|nr:hypothetical protein PCANB_000618 [Pneumocystis canis]